MTTDWQLLDRYASNADQAAFAELVRRHVDFVYGTARRSLGGPGQESEDVAQAVFLLLARKAEKIPRHGTITGWLFNATRYCCANVRKTQSRRRKHERAAGMMRQDEKLADHLLLVLDEGLAKLGDKERQAVMVRYLQGKTNGETGAALGISEEAVEKRLERGMARLRRFFAGKGFAVPAAGFAGTMMAEGAKSAPIGLAATAAIPGNASAAAIGIAKGAAAMMKMAIMKMAMAAMLAILLATGAAMLVHAGGANIPPAAALAAPTAAGAPQRAATTAPSDEDARVVAMLKLFHTLPDQMNGRGSAISSEVETRATGETKTTREISFSFVGQSIKTEAFDPPDHTLPKKIWVETPERSISYDPVPGGTVDISDSGRFGFDDRIGQDFRPVTFSKCSDGPTMRDAIDGIIDNIQHGRSRVKMEFVDGGIVRISAEYIFTDDTGKVSRATIEADPKCEMRIVLFESENRNTVTKGSLFHTLDEYKWKQYGQEQRWYPEQVHITGNWIHPEDEQLTSKSDRMVVIKSFDPDAVIPQDVFSIAKMGIAPRAMVNDQQKKVAYRYGEAVPRQNQIP